MYFFSLPGEREKSLPTVRQDIKKKKQLKQEEGSYFTFVCKEEALVCFPDSVLEDLDLFHYCSEKESPVFW